MSKKPVIAVDIDDVLAQSTDALRVVVNQRLGANLQAEHYAIPGDYRQYYENVWAANGLAGRVTLNQLDPQMKADQSHIKPYNDALRVLKHLSRKYELVIVTGRSSDWRDATEAWLKKHFPNVFSNLFFGEGLEGLSRKTKGELCLESGANWLIDDNVEHALSAEKVGIKAIIFGSYGWHHKIPTNMTRVKNWQEVLEYFDAV